MKILFVQTEVGFLDLANLAAKVDQSQIFSYSLIKFTLNVNTVEPQLSEALSSEMLVNQKRF